MFITWFWIKILLAIHLMWVGLMIFVVNYIFRLENLDTEFSNFLIKKGLNFEKIKNLNQGKIKTTKTHNKSLMIKLKDRYKNDYKLLKQSI